METITVRVDGMTCGGCESSITKALLTHPEITDVKASHTAGTVDVSVSDASISMEALTELIEGAGFDVLAGPL